MIDIFQNPSKLQVCFKAHKTRTSKLEYNMEKRSTITKKTMHFNCSCKIVVTDDQNVFLLKLFLSQGK